MNKKVICGECGSITNEYIYRFDILDAKLLLAMALVIRDNQRTINFTEANRVNVTKLQESLAIRCRTTQASKLGLIAKYKSNGKHVRCMWVITDRGWDALRGEPVPKEVRVFRKNITERTEEKITISQAFKIQGYKPSDWYDIGVPRVEVISSENQPLFV